MHSSLTPKIGKVKNRYQLNKEILLSTKITYNDYKKLVSKVMMGKKGDIRSMNSIRVEGKLR